MAGREVILELRGIVKSFPGVRALDGAELELRRGEVHALVGENGAGKSTLMNVVAGVCQPDEGQIVLEGRAVRLATPAEAARQGIGVVFQELSLSANLSIAENIFAHRQPVWGLNLINWRALHAQTRELLRRFELDLPPTTLVADLSPAQRQVVEILKAMSHRPRVLILDEPTSSLSGVETKLLFENIRQLRSQGVAFIYISHHLGEIFQIADRVTVMRDGQYVETMEVAQASEERIVRRMVGRELKDVYGRREVALGERYFEVKGAGRGKRFSDVSFELRRGEILGLSGLVGAGRTELGRALAGIEPLEQGQVLLEGRALRLTSPGQAIGEGMGYLTEDRKEQGLFLRMGIGENCMAPSLRKFAGALGWMKDGMAQEFAEACRERFGIVASSTAQAVGSLSGGNQQKVLLSMWMGIGPKVLIVDEPTRGVDVGARSEIYALLRELAASGVGIVLISSDLPEVLGLSDRVLVMRSGRLVGAFEREEASEERIIAAATGVDLELT